MADITITEGDTLEVDYSLENTGDGTGTFDPRLLVEGVQEDQDTGITLNPAQTATGTLQWPTENGDAVTDATAAVATDDTSDSITVTVESAIPDSALDYFEDGDVAEYGGDGVIEVTTDAYEGDYAGTATTNGISSRTDVGPTSDGYEIELYMKSDGTGNPGGIFLFQAQNEEGSNGFNGYFVTPLDGNGNTVTGSMENGSRAGDGNGGNDQNFTSSSLSPDTWYRTVVTVESNADISVTFNDPNDDTQLESISHSPNTKWTGGGGIGIWHAGGQPTVDNIRLL